MAQNNAQPAPEQPTSRLTRQAPAQPGTWKCACGAVNDGNFCASCGAKRPKVYRCNKCGWTPKDKDNLPKFCPQCGDPFGAEDVK